MKKITIYISIILILIAGVGLFFMQDIVNYLTKTEVQKNDVELSKDDLYLDLVQNKLKSKITKEDFIKGFWYEGPNGLVYFNIDKLLKLGYSMEEIQEMINRIKKYKNIIKKGDIKILSENELADDEQFHNKLYKSSALLDNNYLKIKIELEKKNPKKAVDYFRLSEIYSFEGEYKKSQKYLDIACKKDKKYCKKNTVEIFGRVIDHNSKPLANVEVKVLSSEKKTKTDANGKFYIKTNLVKLKKERISFTKEGYSSVFKSVTNIADLQKKINLGTIQTSKTDNIYTLNTKTAKIEGHLAGFKNNNFILKTKLSTYYIPKDSIVNENDKKYLGVVKAYLFEFNDQNVPESLLKLDSFSKDRNFLGTSMITFGMPYIILTKEDGGRLYVKSTKPMILETKIQVVSDLWKSEVIDDDLKKEIIKKSKEGKFYYTIKNINKDYVPIPPYWCLDQKTGVWENTGFDVIDFKNGILRAKFYTTK